MLRLVKDLLSGFQFVKFFGRCDYDHLCTETPEGSGAGVVVMLEITGVGWMRGEWAWSGEG